MKKNKIIRGYGIIHQSFFKIKELKSSDKLVFCCLSSYAGSKEECWPSQKLISSDTGLSIKTVRKSLYQLEKIGILKIEKLNDNSWSRNLKYTLYSIENIKDENQENGKLDPTSRSNLPIREGKLNPLKKVSFTHSIYNNNKEHNQSENNHKNDVLTHISPSKKSKKITKKSEKQDSLKKDVSVLIKTWNETMIEDMRPTDKEIKYLYGIIKRQGLDRLINAIKQAKKEDFNYTFKSIIFQPSNIAKLSAKYKLPKNIPREFTEEDMTKEEVERFDKAKRYVGVLEEIKNERIKKGEKWN